MSDKTDPVGIDTTESSTAPGADRRTVLKGAAAAGIATATYLRGFSLSNPAHAQTGAPVKLGFIEDESGNLSVYGIQKLHAAQLAVKEINEGKTLKGAAGIGAGQLGVMGKVAAKPPIISKEGTDLDLVSDGGPDGQDRSRLRGGGRRPRSTRARRASSAASSSSSRSMARATTRCGSSSPAG